MSFLRRIAPALVVLLPACNDITQPNVAAVTSVAVPSSVSAGPFAYVVNNGSSTVSVIDVTANTVLTSISLGVGVLPGQIAITPDGAFAYVTVGVLNSVAVIETATNTVLTSIDVAPVRPSGLAITPDGEFVYVMSGTVNSDVVVIETATNSVVQTVPVALGGVSGIAVTPEGDFVYVAGFGFGQSSAKVIETANNSIVATIPLAHSPTDLVITPDGAFAYLTLNSLNVVSLISLASNTVVANIPIAHGPNLLAITPDGAFAYITHAPANLISVMETATNTIVTTILPGQQYSLRGLDFTPDGAFAYVAAADGSILPTPGAALVIETATNTIVDNVVVELNPSSVAITPNPVMQVMIDIKPENDGNEVGLSREPDVLVALLGSHTFDVGDVDLASLRFGPGAAQPDGPESHADINRDGEPDLILRFATVATGLQPGDSQACLTGDTLDGTTFQGCDTVVVVGPPPVNPVGPFTVQIVALRTSDADLLIDWNTVPDATAYRVYAPGFDGPPTPFDDMIAHPTSQHTITVQRQVSDWDLAVRVTPHNIAGGGQRTIELVTIPAALPQPALPAPELVLKGTVVTPTFVRYLLTVVNRDQYSDVLFASAPHLPPCGLNTNASRTWVDIFHQNGTRIYGFCALQAAAHLDNIWFAVPHGTVPPPAVYITLTDRETGRVVTSNQVAIP